jgi:hypothetical protein
MSFATPLAIYGYNIIVPDEEPLQFIHDIISINDTLVEPIQVHCITPSLAMSGLNDVQVIIGFIPDNNLSRNMIHLDALREFIMDNPMFDGIDMNEKPEFYTGYKWADDISSEEEIEEESEDSDDVSEDSENSDTVSDDYDSSDVSSDESDDHTETDDKSISYYVSKYYI